jgi:hypothetical protein
LQDSYSYSFAEQDESGCFALTLALTLAHAHNSAALDDSHSSSYFRGASFDPAAADDIVNCSTLVVPSWKQQDAHVQQVKKAPREALQNVHLNLHLYQYEQRFQGRQRWIFLLV